MCISLRDHLGDLVVKASASRADDPGFESRLRRHEFIRVESYLELGLGLGLAGPVSVYCD